MDIVKVRCAILDKRAKVPAYAKDGDAGFDLSTITGVTVPANTTVHIPTGLAMAIPVGYELQIRPRSGVAKTTPLIMKNSPGTIDSGYRGEIGILMHNTSETPYYIHEGYRIAQGVLSEVPQAVFEFVDFDQLGETERGAGGFGHTGF